MRVALLEVELFIPFAHSLKEKRHVVKSLKDRLRHRYNVSVAEIDGQESWQRSVIAAVTVSSSRAYAQQVLQAVEDDAAGLLGAMLISAFVDWVDE